MLTLLATIAAAQTEPHLLGDQFDLPEGTTVWTAASLVNLRSGPRTDTPVVRRLPAATRLTVLDDIGPWVEVKMGPVTGWVSRELLSTMGRRGDLDGDGIEERIVVNSVGDGPIVAWLREGDRTQRVTLYAWPDPYMGSWAEVPAAEAGVNLVRVDLNQDSCGSYPTVWLSYTGDTLRRALEVEPWADGGYGASFDVRFAEPGKATVREETYGELGENAVSERSCTLQEGVFHCS